ncbi:MAG: GrdX family protein [Defluviitaleaceae bacterium]|nr:GrdX family protein [Defluviitaleaceae bacterium]
MAKARFSNIMDIEYHEASYLEVLTYVRDYIHKGHQLLTHPLSGSIKPNETPYKSVLISKQAQNLDLRSLSIIEESIVCFDKFSKNILQISDHFCKDYMEVDCDFIAKEVMV